MQERKEETLLGIAEYSSLSDEVLQKIKQQYGFTDTNMLRDSLGFLISRFHDRKYLSEYLLSDLLKNIAGYKNPDIFLNEIIEISKKQINPCSYIRYLQLNPWILELYHTLFSSNSFLKEMFLNNPYIIDYTLFHYYHNPFDEDEYNIRYDNHLSELDNHKDIKKKLTSFAICESFSIGLMELTGRINHIRAQKMLSRLLELIIKSVFCNLIKEPQIVSLLKSNVSICILSNKTLAAMENTWSDCIELLFLYDYHQTSVELSNDDYHFQFRAVSILENLFENILTMLNNIGNQTGEFTFRYFTTQEISKSRKPLVSSRRKWLYSLQDMNISSLNSMLSRLRIIAGNNNIGEKFITDINNLIYKKYLRECEIISLRDGIAVSHYITSHLTKTYDLSNISQITKTDQLYQMMTTGISNIKSIISFLIIIKRCQKACIPDDLSTTGMLEMLSDNENNEDILAQLSELKESFSLFLMVYRTMILADSVSKDADSEDSNLFGKDNNNPDYINDFLKHRYPLPNCHEDIFSILISKYNTIRTIFHKYFEETGNLPFEKKIGKLICFADTNDVSLPSIFDELPFKEPDRSIQFLKTIAGSLIDNPSLFYEFIRILLKLLKNQPASDQIVFYLTELLRKYRSSNLLIRVLISSQEFLEILISVFGTSRYLSDMLIKNPEYVDFLNMLDINAKADSSFYKSWYDYLLQQSGDVSTALIQLKEVQTIKIGIKELFYKADTKETAYELSGLAEFILSEIVRYSQDDQKYHFLKNKYSDEGFATEEHPSLGMIFFGKFSAKEMRFGSDLDIIFVMDSQEDEESAAIDREFYSHVIGKISAILKGEDTSEFLYELDLRLRPTGRNAPVIFSINRLESYLQESSSEWERLIYLRARVVSDDENLQKKISDLIRSFVVESCDIDKVKQQIKTLREKSIETINPQGEYTDINLAVKKGPGGLIEVDFIALFLALKESLSNNPILETSIFSILSILYKRKIISSTNHSILKSGYKFLLDVQNMMQLICGIDTQFVPTNEQPLEILSLRMEFDHPHEFMEHYLEIRKKINMIYKEIFD